MRVIVTRPAAQAITWVRGLRDAGIDAVALPLIDIDPPADPQAVAAAWAQLPRAALVFFVSPNAVRYFFALAPPDLGWPPNTLAGSPGPGTSTALLAQGVPVGCLVAPADDAPAFDSEALWSRLRTRDWAGAQVMIVRGEGGRDWLAEQLRAAGATVQFVAAYRRRAPSLGEAGRRLIDEVLARPQDHLWLFSSSEAIGHLCKLAPELAGSAGHALVTHPRIGETARRAGFGSVLACAPAMGAVVQAIQGRSIQSSPP